MTRVIRVVPYNPNWAKEFEAEADSLLQVFDQQAEAIHHIGSTAIPTTCAKPIIDMLVQVRDIEKIDRFNVIMTRRGYEPRGEFGIPGRRFFSKGPDEKRTHHVHVFRKAHPEIERHVNFRDYLIAHPGEGAAYCRLKQELASRFPHCIDSYLEGKSHFIREVDQRAKEWRERLDQSI